MKEQFVNTKFTPQSLITIQQANAILDEYRVQGYRLSLRQLYYQLVARDFIPNTQRSYKNLGNLVSHARQAGYIDWEMIEDRNRETVSLSHWADPGEILKSAARAFHLDHWEKQDAHVEVMVEKDALSGVLVPVCNSLDVSLTANKGYSSSSTMYEIGKRLEWYYEEGKEIHILYLGDHDPSGIDMTRDVADRLSLYSGIDADELPVERLALNWDQVQTWKPPENPAKDTDARYASYVEEYGYSSWELDSIDPTTLGGLVRDAIENYIDRDAWKETHAEEGKMRATLDKLAATWQEHYKENEDDQI